MTPLFLFVRRKDMTNWPHAPLHHLVEQGAYMVTCGTYLKQHHLNSSERLNFFRDLLFICSQEFGWQLQAWAILSNHYHWVGISPDNPGSLKKLVSKLHTLSARQLNQWDSTPGRKVWFQYYDSKSHIRLHTMHGLNMCIKTPYITAWRSWR